VLDHGSVGVRIRAKVRQADHLGPCKRANDRLSVSMGCRIVHAPWVDMITRYEATMGRTYIGTRIATDNVAPGMDLRPDFRAPTGLVLTRLGSVDDCDCEVKVSLHHAAGCIPQSSDCRQLSCC
jgi:hypothetical protein